MAHYIHDEKNNRIDGMSKEEIYALLAEAIQQGQLPVLDQDTAFVTMIKSITDGQAYKIGICTQAQYNQLEAQGALEVGALYIITDDTSYNDIVAQLNNLNSNDASLQGAIDGLSTDVYQRLAELGFKEGVSSYSGLTLGTDATLTNTLKKQGKYCIFNLYGSYTILGTTTKDGLNWSGGSTVTITIPTEFRPKANTTIVVGSRLGTTIQGQIAAYTFEATVTTSGTITFTAPTGNSYFCILNAGWELA